jgi:hypothetical protein
MYGQLFAYIQGMVRHRRLLARPIRTGTRLERAEKGCARVIARSAACRWFEALRVDGRPGVKNEGQTKTEQGGAVYASDVLKIMSNPQQTTGFRQSRNLTQKSGRYLAGKG